MFTSKNRSGSLARGGYRYYSDIETIRWAREGAPFVKRRELIDQRTPLPNAPEFRAYRSPIGGMAPVYLHPFSIPQMRRPSVPSISGPNVGGGSTGLLEYEGTGTPMSKAEMAAMIGAWAGGM
jgi:hypothetical protein